MKIEFYSNNLHRFNSNCERFGLNKPIAYYRELFCFLRFGCSPDDYFRYEFYKKSNYERNKFVTYRRSKKIIKKYNNLDFANVFNDKLKFNKKFSDYVNRDYLDMRTVEKDLFEDFVRKHHAVLIKPLFGGQGIGIFKLTENELDSFDLENNRNCIAEEILVQHEMLSKLNPSSVNTVRILTFKKEIVACALRIGGDDSVVDNLHSNGVCAHIDIETGIIDAKCIDNKLNKYIKHPMTDIILVGWQIPNWNELKQFVNQITGIVPEVQYVGWDIAVLKDGFAVIEGNHDPGHDVVQMIAQTGIYDKLKRLM